MKTIKLDAIYNDDDQIKSTIYLIKWANLAGFDLTITSKYHTQMIAITFEEFHIIKGIVKVLDFESNVSVNKKEEISKSLVTVGITGNNSRYLVSIQTAGRYMQQIKIKFDEFHFIKKAAKKLEGEK
jgi:hypothetical protein